MPPLRLQSPSPTDSIKTLPFYTSRFKTVLESGMLSVALKAVHQIASVAEKATSYFVKSAQPRHLALKSHDRLFNLFFPTEKFNDHLTDAQRQKLPGLKEAIWKKLAMTPEAIDVLTALSFNPFLSGSQHFVDPSRHYSFLMRHVSPNLFFQLRALYLTTIYGSSLGEELADYSNNAKPTLSLDVEEMVANFKSQTLSGFNPDAGIYFDAATKSIRHKDGEFDFVIVGSGAGGSVLAHELNRAGFRVLVLEKGSFFVPGSINGTRESQFYESKGVRFTKNGQILVRNGEVAGGGPSVNIDLAFAPTLPSVVKRLEKWRQLGLLHYTRQRIESAYNWVEAMLGTRDLSFDEVNANNRVLWDGSKTIGWVPELYRLNRRTEEASQNLATGKISALERLLIPAMSNAENPLYLLTDAAVQKFEFEMDGKKRRVAKVRLTQGAPVNSPSVIGDPMGLNIPEGTEFTVSAKQFILSAGALSSPALLLNSDANKFNRQIGRGIVMHPCMPVVAEFDRPINSSTGLTASVFNAHFANIDGHEYFFEAMDGTPEIVSAVIPGDGKEVFDSIRRYQFMSGFGPMIIDTVNKQNRVRIDGNGKTVVDYKLSETDKNRFRKALLHTAQIAFSAGAKRVTIPSLEMGQAFFDNLADFSAALEHLDFIPGQNIIPSAHIQASLKMSNSEKTGAVDTDQRLYGVENLWVGDGSVFPASIGANPMQSIYTFAKLLAESLIAKFGQQVPPRQRGGLPS